MIGATFNKLTVLEPAGKTKWNELLWRCRCSCGNETTVQGKRLRSGGTRSCGCARHDIPPKHGGKGTRLYRTWAGMKDRCLNPKSKDYKRWGGAGVTVCAEWRQFEGFRDWARQSGYADALLIDRIDPLGSYEPANCRWVTPAESSRHTRAVKLSFEAAAQIRALVAEGHTHQHVADRFNVCRANVSLICEGRLWV